MNYEIRNIVKENYEASKQLAEGVWYIQHKLSEDEMNATCICAVVYHEPTEEDFAELVSSHLADCKRLKLTDIKMYDISANVNSFTLNGAQAWLDKATRVGLVNLLDSQKAEGQTETTLWLNGTPIVLGVDAALGMLRQLEIYAGLCYNKTEAHKAAIAQLTTAAEVEAYDYTAGYPEQPVFEINAE